MPLSRIDEAYQLIRAEAPSNVNTAPILKYFDKTWMANGLFPPSEWNQYGQMENRTNNLVESYNSQVNKKLKMAEHQLRLETTHRINFDQMKLKQV